MKRTNVRQAAHRIVMALSMAALLLAAGEIGALADEPATAPTFMAGMAKVDITPDVTRQPIPLSGYFDRHRRPATSVHDPIFAKALVYQDALGNLFAIVSLDLCYTHSEVIDPALKQLAQAGFHQHNIMISSTHSHSGFGGFDSRLLSRIIVGNPNRDMLDLAVTGITAAVFKAKDRMRPAVVEIGSTELEGMNRSRHDPAFDFVAGGAGKTMKFDPEKYPTDTTLSVVRFRTTEGEPIGLFFNYSSHPTILSPKSMAVSAEWPGVACDKIEKSMGDKTVAMFLNGSLGDAAPRPDWDELEIEWKNMVQYGNEMGDAVIALSASLAPMQNPVAKGRSVRKEFSQLVVRALFKSKLPKEASRLGYKRPDQPLQAFRLGSLYMMAVPGEPTTAVGNQVKALCPEGGQCLVVAPANGYIGYFADREEYAEGGYAADASMFGPDAHAKVIEGLKEALMGIQ